MPASWDHLHDTWSWCKGQIGQICHCFNFVLTDLQKCEQFIEPSQHAWKGRVILLSKAGHVYATWPYQRIHQRIHLTKIWKSFNPIEHVQYILHIHKFLLFTVNLVHQVCLASMLTNCRSLIYSFEILRTWRRGTHMWPCLWRNSCKYCNISKLTGMAAVSKFQCSLYSAWQFFQAIPLLPYHLPLQDSG